MKTKQLTKQIYSDYTSQDFLVWKLLFERQLKALRPVVSSEYLNALEVVGFSPGKIPDFDEVNRRLMPLTGWSLEVVPAISPQKEFFTFLSRKKFTATCWLRSIAQLDYLEEPDMFHDVFGHVPLLSNPAYVGFFKGISDIALKHLDDPRAIELLGKMYWFTIEFGLIREKQELKIYGAGIISSAEETRVCLSTEVSHHAFDIEAIFKTDFRTDTLQKDYFMIESFEQLYASLPELETVMHKTLRQTTMTG